MREDADRSLAEAGIRYEDGIQPEQYCSNISRLKQLVLANRRQQKKSVMAKSKRKIVPPQNHELDDVAQGIAAIRKLGRELRADPKKARAFFVELGVCTKSGQITKNYGGTA